MEFGPWVDLEEPLLPDARDLPARCDVAVIGGGLAGCMAALTLARSGVEVVLLEARPHVGLGASGRHLGHLDLCLLEHPHRTVKAIGATKTRALIDLALRNQACLEPFDLVDRCGGVWASLDQREPAEVEASVQALADLGVAAELLSGEEAERRTGAYNLGPSLWLPDMARMDPWDAVVTLAQQAEDAGATVLGQCPARLLPDADDGVLIAVGEGRLQAEAVVVAAGASSGEVEPKLKSHLTPVREQALMTAPVFAHYPGIHRAGHGYNGWRQLPDGNLIVHGCRWASPHLEVGESDDAVISERVQQKIEAFFRYTMPAAEEVEVIGRWAWVFHQSRDGLPLVGPLPGDPRRLVVAGTGGTGASFEAALGEGVARAILGEEHGLPDFLAATRLTRWR